MLSKAEAREIVRELVDDPAGERWRDRILDVYAGAVLDELWAQILTHAPYALHAAFKLPADADGFIQLQDLPERFHRVLQVSRGGEALHPVTPKSLQLDGRTYRGPQGANGYAILGREILVLPVRPLEEVQLLYSHFPTRFSDLPVDAAVEWPEGMESAYLHEIAGRAMTKGGAEDPSVHLQIAQRSMQQCIALMERLYPGPMMLGVTSHAADWGGT